jgi:molecular chaperone GrpE
VGDPKSRKIPVSKNEDEVAAESPAAADSSPAPDALAKLQAEKDELLQTLVRRQADFENYRKRVERERHEESRRGIGRVLEDLLPVLDGFERALQSSGEGDAGEQIGDHIKGVQLVQKQLWEALAKHGLTRIEAEGKHFDPHLHLAIERVETAEHPDGIVLEVLQQGYKFHDRVLRPSVVRVAVHPAGLAGTHTQTTKSVN